jgi:hypothetical protein
MMLQRSLEAGTGLLVSRLAEHVEFPAQLLDGLGIAATRPVLADVATIRTSSQVRDRAAAASIEATRALLATREERIADILADSGCTIRDESDLASGNELSCVTTEKIGQLAKAWEVRPDPRKEDDPLGPVPPSLLEILESMVDESLLKAVERLRAERLRGGRGDLGGDPSLRVLCAVGGHCIVDQTTFRGYSDTDVDTGDTDVRTRPTMLDRIRTLAGQYRNAKGLAKD